MAETKLVNGREYALVKLLGHGKGGYSYLAERAGRFFVLKQIHHEPCAYYAFGNKIEAENRDYARLKQAGIRVPEMVEIDEKAERIVKEYIEGPTALALARTGRVDDSLLSQVREMAALAERAGLNIDYFPANFVARQGILYYVDYECNAYMPEWNFENWGVRYWSRTPEFEAYVKEHPMNDPVEIRRERLTADAYIDFLKRTDLGAQYPKERFRERIARLLQNASVSLVARNELGDPVGVLLGLTDFAYWLYVTDLGVDRDYQRRGIGRRLMAAALDAAGGEKDIAVYLVANEKAVPFYEKLGMKKAEDVMQYNHIEWTEFTVE